MPDEKLTPASRHDIETCLALALTSGRALARSQAAETMSKVVAERLAAELEASGFVVMREPLSADRRRKIRPQVGLIRSPRI